MWSHYRGRASEESENALREAELSLVEALAGVWRADVKLAESRHVLDQLRAHTRTPADLREVAELEKLVR